MTSTRGTGRDRRSALIRVLLISAIVALLFFVVSMIAAYVICGMIFARVDDRGPLVPDYDILTDPPPRTEVRFSGGDHTLCGYLYETESPQGLILIAHGMRGDGDAHLPAILYFLSHGWSVFTFDGTGTGASPGDSAIGLEQMVLDLCAAMDYVATSEATASLPLMLYGHSMGGYAATIAAASGRADSRAVVSIAGFNSPRAVMLQNGRRYVGEIAVLGYPFLCLQNRLTFGSYADLRAVDAINDSNAAFLIVYGAGDKVISMDESIYGRREAITNPAVTYLYIEDSRRDGHSEAWLSADAVAYRDALETELSALTEQYGNGLPPEVLAEFEGRIDRQALYELDEEFMSSVLQFYTDALVS